MLQIQKPSAREAHGLCFSCSDGRGYRFYLLQGRCAVLSKRVA
jgi:hypothetical protein